MSLRDQLVAKGLVSKKRARQAERELTQDRRTAQARQPKKRVLEREEAARRAADEAAAEGRRVEERQQREAGRAAAEHALRVRNVILGNRLPLGRGQRFWHRSPDGCRVLELQVSSGVAHNLRSGEAALAHHEQHGFGEVVAIPRHAALTLRELAPERLLHFVEDPQGISAPDLALHRRDWEVELGPRRATESDLQAWRARGT